MIKQSGPHISKKKTMVIKNAPPSASSLPHARLPTNVLPAKPKQPSAPPVNFTKRPSPSYGSQGHAVSPHNPTVSSTVSSTKPLSPSLSSTTSSSAARSSGNPAVMSMPYRYVFLTFLSPIFCYSTTSILAYLSQRLKSSIKAISHIHRKPTKTKPKKLDALTPMSAFTYTAKLKPNRN